MLQTVPHAPKNHHISIWETSILGLDDIVQVGIATIVDVGIVTGGIDVGGRGRGAIAGVATVVTGTFVVAHGALRALGCAAVAFGVGIGRRSSFWRVRRDRIGHDRVGRYGGGGDGSPIILVADGFSTEQVQAYRS